jgi:glutamate-1-semialdehyde aminotransferase
MAFKRGMITAGVDTMSGNLFIVSATHGDREVDETVAAFEKVLEQMKREGFV